MKMISKALVLLTILGLSYSADAQGIKLGGRAGINLGNVDFSGDGLTIETDSKVGLAIAFLADIGITENFSVQPELHFLQKGYKVEFGGEEGKATLNYIEIPVNAKYSFGEPESVGGFVMAGPSIGFGTNYKAEIDGEEEESGSFDEGGLKATEFSLNLGGGVTIPAAPGTVVIDVRYLLGLSDIDDEDDELEVKNRGLGFGVSFLAPIGGSGE